MTIHMKNLERLSLAEMQEFVQGSRKLTLSLEGQAAIYGFIEALLKAQQYRRLSRRQRGRCGDDHPNGPIFPGGTPAPMWSCWPRWTPLTRSYPGQPPVTSWSAISASSA